jgi:transcription elongation factor Elf1
MDWEVIINAYPEDAAGIEKARQIYSAVVDAVEKLEVQSLDCTLPLENIADLIAPAKLAEVCRCVWKDVLGKDPDVDIDQALTAFISGGSIPEPEQDAEDLLPMFLRPVVSTYLRRVREKNNDLIKTLPGSGKCPFCGMYPRMCFDSESSRDLHCLMCGQEWRFQRVKCPFCGNSDHTTLGYFEVEGIEGIRVYFCSECKHYVKVVETKTRLSHDAETEDILSLVLDAAAQEEGYL